VNCQLGHQQRWQACASECWKRVVSGGKELLNLAGEGTTRLGSEGGSFSLEGLCLQEGWGLVELREGVGKFWRMERENRILENQNFE